MKTKLLYTGIMRAALAGLVLMGGGAAWGQSAPDTTATTADETPPSKSDIIIITGTRTEGRSVSDSPVPVDVLTAEAIEDISFTDTNDILKTLVPSYTIARQPISDGATFIRPAALRGLASDKTLVLVNSKRRHRAALVSIGGSGTQGPDIATIPASALKSVEVLRDGAAAQYGSDAIAGVMNFILKDAPEGGEIQFQAGGYKEGDGEDILIAGNLGLALGQNGFINISVEGTTAQPTNRGMEWAIQRGNTNGVNWQQGSFDVATFLAANPQYSCVVRVGRGFRLVQRADLGTAGIRSVPDLHQRRLQAVRHDGAVCVRELLELARRTATSTIAAPSPASTRRASARRTGSIFQYLSNYPAGPHAALRRQCGRLLAHRRHCAANSRTDLTYDFTGPVREGHHLLHAVEHGEPVAGQSVADDFPPRRPDVRRVRAQRGLLYTMPVSFLPRRSISVSAPSIATKGYEIVPGDEASWIAGPYAPAGPVEFLLQRNNSWRADGNAGRHLRRA